MCTRFSVTESLVRPVNLTQSHKGLTSKYLISIISFADIASHQHRFI
jgi:hypothetical protein